MGLAAASAITLFLIIFLATVLQRRFVGGDQTDN
jgi:ABC-type sugar transport system permease subunit